MPFVVMMVLAELLAPRQAAAQVDPAWLGTWTLNVAESSYEPGPPPYRRGTCTIEPQGDDGLRMVYELVRVRGGVTRLEWAGTLDGREYPVQGLDSVMTYGYQRLDERTYEVAIKLDQQLVGTARVMISTAGNRLTTVTTGVGPTGRAVYSTTVYDKQSP